MQLAKALPDESLYSRICRCLSIYEYSTEQALELLVGDKRAAIHPYLTSNLSVLAQATGESSKVLLSCQTLRPLFSYYLPQYKKTIEDVAATTNEVIRASQLSTFRGNEVLSVKYCPICARNDLHEYGVAYWHLSHQIPGVEACSAHSSWLVHQELPSRNHVRCHFLPSPQTTPIHCTCIATEFAFFVTKRLLALQVEGEHQSRSVSSEYYRKQLALNGFVTANGRVRRKSILEGLYELSERLFLSPTPLSVRSKSDFSFLSTLLSGKYSQHPFKHLMLEFYLSKCQPPTLDTVKSLPIELAVNVEEKCCDLLKSGLSMAAVSREIGKSRCYVKSMALKHKIPVNLKPKKITLSLKASVISLARRGFHREVIAKLHNISSGSVELIISSTSGLVAWRKKCKFESLRRRYRHQIIRFIGSTPETTRQEIKNAQEAAYYWLYNHEHEWLETVLPNASKTQHVDRVDWCQRDNELVKVISELLLSTGNKLSRTELDKALGGHGWLTSKLKKMPKTKELLKKNNLFSSNT
ncbi:TnsD family Tn7-like transposition protein [Vibrio coralliilyticus]|uniref:TnsD family Tn7-like transposition protein n=1 Tax=Vibrio coralliilyticus TaxID=190893 RepID=UPI00148D689C|nr:TnsD family Tn7-like transposition protein [Vibrio coralliilyticus]NOI31045.1 transposase [Vibrio coralliilyticus]NOI50265.1 transposase [Vibrio coralliilyticus]